MGVPTYVDERERTLVVALEEEGLTPVRLTVEKAWMDEHGTDELREIVPMLTAGAVEHLENGDIEEGGR